MEKLMTTSKKLDFVFGVTQKIIIAVVAIMLVVLPVLFFFNTGTANDDGNGYNIIDISGIRLEISEKFAPDTKEFLVYMGVTTALAIAIVTVIYCMISIIRKILKPMTEGCPFDKSVGYNIRKIANMTIILGLLANAFSAVETIGTIFLFRLSELFAEGAVRKVSANLSFDVTFFIVYFILLLISHIFIYGTELQKLSDETL
ncbi:MAG: hypothetical protein IKL21_07365 [Clostridia bacterium]|nr:hypothetical protein [Clostridia bacterium]